MIKKVLIITGWILSLILVTVHTYENPEYVEKIKSHFTKNQTSKDQIVNTDISTIPGNSFLVKFSKKFSFNGKSAFAVHERNQVNFDVNLLKIYTQSGFILKNKKSTKINLPDNFTEVKNGGIKSVFIYNENDFGLISSLENDCYYASIVWLNKGKEVFKTACLPKDKIDFNGLGSSHIHKDEKIYLSIGAPEQASSSIRALAQDKNSMFGKIIEINYSDLDKIIADQKKYLPVKIFSSGHRNPQGLTKIDNYIFSVEHGPKGGDELNKIENNKNYGWPNVSYGIQYNYEEKPKAYTVNHETNGFREPIFALLPSVGISSLNQCPSVLKNYYKKPCLLALSLNGNSLRPGRSIIIFLLSEKMDQVHSAEQIHLVDENDRLRLRHFITNNKNELYEDSEGSIYATVDNKGVYKINFTNFRD